MPFLRRALIGIAALLGAIVGIAGCSSREAEKDTRVYVSIDRLEPLHPAMPALNGAAGEGQAAQHAALPAPGADFGDGPPPLHPFEVAASRDQRPERESAPDSQREARFREMEAGVTRRSEKAAARSLRLDTAALEAERAETYREAESRIQEKQRELTEVARGRLRSADLRIVALESQIGSLAAGPPQEVQAALKAAREEKAQIERRLSVELANVRGAEIRRVRETLEASEAERAHRREIDAAARSSDLLRALRAYRSTLRGAPTEIPDMRVPEPMDTGRAPVSVDASVARQAAGARAAGRRSSLTISGPDPELLRLIREDTLRCVRRVAADRGWSIVLKPAPDVPDRTEEMARALDQAWGRGRSNERDR